ncbi:MAG: membrane protein insertion efficiency factor YidD [Spirochaetes bacterium]|nr:membrane protein insertion efficiency factor YidD [Spirochaetota bacterium]
MKYEAHSHKKTASVKKIFSAPVSAGYFLIRCYQIVISPQDGPSCRFSPTCSVYGKEAVIKHGIIKGSFLAGERLIRCNPYNKGGKDPVPEKIFE